MTLYTEGFSHFVTSMTAPVVSGGSKIAGRDSHPQERRHLFMAHVELGHANFYKFSDQSPTSISAPLEILMEIFVCHYKPNYDRKRYLDSLNLSMTYITDFDKEDLGNISLEKKNAEVDARLVFEKIAPTLLANISLSNRSSVEDFFDYNRIFQESQLKLANSDFKERFMSILCKPLSLAEVSIFEKHRECLRRIVASGKPYSLVIEDDAIFSNTSIDQISTLMGLDLGLNSFIDIAGGAGLSPINVFTHDFKSGIGLYKISPPFTRTICSYVVGIEFAETFINLNPPPCVAIDHFYTYLFQTTLPPVYWTMPTILGHGSELDRYQSSIR